MSKKEREIHLNQSTEYENSTFPKTGYSNSRLHAHTVCISKPKISFDRMTIVGNLNKDNAKKLSDFMTYEPRFRLWDMLQTKFKGLQRPFYSSRIKNFELLF